MSDAETQVGQLRPHALSPKEVGELLGMPERTVVDLLHRGIIPGRKLGKYWRVHPDVMDRLLPKGDENVVPLPLKKKPER
jgi:excisionase family DNA binding protein